MIRPEACIHLDGAGIDLGAVRAACVKPLATDVDPAVIHAKPCIAARRIAQDVSRREDGAGGIQKAGAIGINPVRVCDDDVGFRARHFEESAQL